MVRRGNASASALRLPDTTERNAGMLRVRSSHRMVGLATGSCCASPCRGRRRPAQACPSSSATTSTMDRALPSSAALRCWSRPMITTRLPLQGLAGVLSLVAPDDHGEERRLLLPPTADGHPEHGSGDATLGVADLGVVGEVAGEAHGWLGHGVPLSVVWPGGLLCPWNRGRRTPWHAERAPGASGGANEVGNGSRLPSGLGSGAGLVGGALVAGGRACQHRPARSLHPGRGGRTRLPPRGPLAGPFQAARGASC